jgi:molybdate transport system substrate-binding protein
MLGTMFNGLCRGAMGIVAALALGTGTAGAQPLAIAAASDLQAVLPELAQQFEAQEGRPVRLTFGSSGHFVSQIAQGAPFDLFLSADVEYPRALVASGRAEQDSLYEYAVGRLVVWSRHDSGVDVGRGLMVLDDAAVRRIAIANPQHAPYGRAAIAVLETAGLHARLRHKLVLGENVSQAAQFVQSGNAQAGLLALSLALAPALQRTGRYALVPESAHPPIHQAAVVITGSRNAALARRFLEFLKSGPVVARLRAAGFARPE